MQPGPAEAAATLMAGGQALLQAFLGLVASQPGGTGAAVGALRLDPARLAELQGRLFRQHQELWQQTVARQAGGAPAAVARPAPGDRRFSSGEWQRHPGFDYARQSYLINSSFLSECVEAIQADGKTKDRLRFAARQAIDAMSPANFMATNPEAIKAALDSGGESLAQGVRNLLADLQKGRISTTDEARFGVGRNLAVTPGAVVLENDLMQLIQYAPLTGTAHKRPLVMVPPCINKFYVLDLQPESSYVRYAVEQGHTVFMVSWRNPGPESAHLRWDDYLARGVLEALRAAREVTRADKVNALGFCVGGTMLGAALAVQAARGEDNVACATFLASMLDFSDTGDIGLLVDEAGVAAREQALGRGGLLPGRELAFVFSMLRANDLVWPYVASNYLQGRSPEAFDILYWNADSTNLPGPMYCEYLRGMYLENALREPGRLSMLGEAVDLRLVDVPAYVLATREDHIVPWRTAYRTTGLLAGEMRFVLGASGHVAGVVNPAARNRRSYWTGETLPADADAWLAAASERPGSWWTDWSAWLAGYGGGQVKARKRLGSARHRPIEPAPGRYVLQRAA